MLMVIYGWYLTLLVVGGVFWLTGIRYKITIRLQYKSCMNIYSKLFKNFWNWYVNGYIWLVFDSAGWCGVFWLNGIIILLQITI